MTVQDIVLLITTIVSLVTALGGGIAGLVSLRRQGAQAKAQNEQIKQSVRRDEIAGLRETQDLMVAQIERLQEDLANEEKKRETIECKYEALRTEFDTLKQKYEREHAFSVRLLTYVGDLRVYIEGLLRIMRDAGLVAPPMPVQPVFTDEDKD